MRASEARMRWWQQLSTCYSKGYAAQKAGVANDACPYKRAQGVQRQRRAYWLRGWERASKGLPENDSNG